MNISLRKLCFASTVLACALVLSHDAPVARGQVSTGEENRALVAAEFESLFEQTDLSPQQRVCGRWISQNELEGRLESDSIVPQLPVPARDSFTSPNSTTRFNDADSVAGSQQRAHRGLLQPIIEQDSGFKAARRIPRPVLDPRLKPASFGQESGADSQIQNPATEVAPQLRQEIETEPPESDGSLIPDETSLEKLETEIKERIELVSKETGDETVKQEQLQQLNTANSWIQKANNYQSLIETQKKLSNSFEARLQSLQSELQESPTAGVPDPTLNSEELQMELQVKRQELQQLKTQLSENQRKMEERDKRIEQLPADRTAAQEELGKSESGLNNLDQQPDGTSKQLSTLILKAKQWAAKKEIEALSIESPRHEESGRLLPLERSVLSRKIQIGESEIQIWNEAYNKKRDQEIVDQANETERLRRQVVDSDPTLNAWAQLNNKLVAERQNWTAGIEAAQTYLKDVTAEREEIESSLKSLNQATEKGITTEVGISLVEQRHGLSLPWESQSRIQANRSKLKDIRLKNLAWQAERQSISSVDAVVEELMMGRHEHGLSAREFDSLARQLVESRVRLLDDLNEDYEVFRDVLVKEDNERVSLINKITEMRNFIDEKALWIQSARPIWEDPIGRDRSDLVKSIEGFSSLSQPAKWTGFSEKIKQRLTRRPYESTLAVLVLASLFIVSRRLRENS